MTPTIHAEGLTRQYGGEFALEDVTLDVEAEAITGLLGRNGSGKTTFMRLVSAQEFATAGTVSVFGQSPVENDAVLRRIVFVREDQVYPDFTVENALTTASWFYPNWSQELADELCADFQLPTKRRIRKLSRGMRSGLSIVLGLASRAELTLLDEPYAGLDAVARHIFYDRLLADFMQHPRTILLSTHLVDEVADLLEHVVMIADGRVVLDAPADDVRGQAATVTGPTTMVEQFISGRHVWRRQVLGTRTSVVVSGPFDDSEKAYAKNLNLTVEPLSLQQLMVHTSQNSDSKKVNA